VLIWIPPCTSAKMLFSRSMQSLCPKALYFAGFVVVLVAVRAHRLEFPRPSECQVILCREKGNRKAARLTEHTVELIAGLHALVHSHTVPLFVPTVKV